MYILENKGYKTLNILTLGHQKCAPSHSFSYALPNFYLLHYVVSGEGTFTKNKVTKKISANEMFIIKPNNIYEYCADEKNPWEYIWISFDGELAKMFEMLDDTVKFNTDIFFEMLDAKNLKNTKNEFLLSKLYELISVLFESTATKTNYTKAVSDYIKANYARKIYVSDIAETLNLNSRYLSRLFKEEKGMSVQEYIINYKMKKAQLFLSKGLNVSEASKSVGYDDIFTFSKIFKKHIGVPPSLYRANALHL